MLETGEDVLRGWPLLKPGTKVKDQIHDTRWKELHFDCTEHHAVLPFIGKRISIVYFTKSKYLQLKDEYKTRLEEAFFQVPGPDWEQCAGICRSSQVGSLTSGSKKQKLERVSEDEDEMLDAQLELRSIGPQWSANERHTLGSKLPPRTRSSESIHPSIHSSSPGGVGGRGGSL